MVSEENEICVIDYETYSEANIKKCGGWEYSLHPSTEILCVAFRKGKRSELASKPTFTWVPGRSETNGAFQIFLAALRNPKVRLVARNAFFERSITKNVFAKKMMASMPELQNLPIERWECTAALSRAMGLPGSLEGSGAALELNFQKDVAGHKHMLKVCRPRKPSKDNPSTRYNSKADIDRLVEYCKRDVDADVEAYLKLPPLHPTERKIWEMDQKVNDRGFAVDRPLVLGALALIAKETVRLDNRVKILTKGKLNSARQRDAVLKYVKAHGMNLPNLQSETVKELLKTPITDPKIRELLEIREAISRSSTAKYAAFEARSRSDGRARDNIIYHGAHTGRDSGTGLQPQNLFKAILKQEDVEVGLELIRRKDHHTIEALYDRPMDLYASALRSCIVAGPGKTLEVGDFATVEVRGLFWVAGHQTGLQILKDGRDLYCEMAGEIYGVDPKIIKAKHASGDKDASFKRTVGKHTVLGAGFGIGLGGEKFQATCKKFGVTISLDLAKRAIRAYRDANPRIPAFWSNIERAAVSAVENPGKAYKIGYLIWKKEGKWLTCKLPSGRKLHYFKPELRRTKTQWGTRLTLTFVANIKNAMRRDTTWGGKLTENVVQAIARDILKAAQLRLEERGHPVVLPVHDEAVSEFPQRGISGRLPEFISTMEDVPEWAKGLPIKVEGWSEPRYRK